MLQRWVDVELICLSRLYGRLSSASVSFGLEAIDPAPAIRAWLNDLKVKIPKRTMSSETRTILELFSSLTQSLPLTSTVWWSSVCSGNASRTVLIVALRRRPNLGAPDLFANFLVLIGGASWSCNYILAAPILERIRYYCFVCFN